MGDYFKLVEALRLKAVSFSNIVSKKRSKNDFSTAFVLQCIQIS